MSAPEILSKLDSLVSTPIDTEARAVYLMVQLRKLMEVRGNANAYPHLKFHANWIAHARISHSSIADGIVALFNELHESSSGGLSGAALDELQVQTSFHTLRKELETFLKAEGIPHANVTSVEAAWAQFVLQLSGVVRDVPLCISSGRSLSHIDSVTVRVADSAPPHGYAGYDVYLEWESVSRTTQARITQHALI